MSSAPISPRNPEKAPEQAPEQAEVIGLLLSPHSYPVPGPVSHIETHGAHIFLCGETALKIKRAVRFDYMDLSTAERRHALLQRELALNRQTAPMIYRDVIPIARRPDGGLELNGTGAPVEWVLRMHRFSSACELTNVAAGGGLTDPVAERLGQTIQQFHTTCPVRTAAGDDLMRDILDELTRVLSGLATPLGTDRVRVFLDGARRHLAGLAPLLRNRASHGHVRRVHGDLHLRNMLLIDDRPVLFDALEFDERLATCDVLYDLAFLLMDMCHRGLGRQANAAMTAYLLAAHGAEDGGLAALPLFLSVRAAIRAMVVMQTGQVTGRNIDEAGGPGDEARRYLDQAIGYLTAPRPRLMAVGGLSGTGKTVLARALAPDLGPCPGAVHLRTDTERKVGPDDVSYAPADRAGIYARMRDRAAAVLAAGHSVVLDATFLDPAERDALTGLARGLAVPLVGLWLTAPPAVLIDRVVRRTGDASDAGAGVVAVQLSAVPPSDDPARQGWIILDASGTPEATRAAAAAALARITCRSTPTADRP